VNECIAVARYVCYSVLSYTCERTHIRATTREKVIKVNSMQTLKKLASSMHCAEPEHANVRSIRDIGIAFFQMYEGVEEEGNEEGHLIPVILYKSHTESGVAATLPFICDDFAEVYMFLVSEAKKSRGEEYAYHLSHMLISHVGLLAGDEGLERITEVSGLGEKESEKMYH